MATKKKTDNGKGQTTAAAAPNEAQAQPLATLEMVRLSTEELRQVVVALGSAADQLKRHDLMAYKVKADEYQTLAKRLDAEYVARRPFGVLRQEIQMYYAR